jgi:hypothetical protein
MFRTGRRVRSGGRAGYRSVALAVCWSRMTR